LFVEVLVHGSQRPRGYDALRKFRQPRHATLLQSSALGIDAIQRQLPSGAPRRLVTKGHHTQHCIPHIGKDIGWREIDGRVKAGRLMRPCGRNAADGNENSLVQPDCSRLQSVLIRWYGAFQKVGRCAQSA
jgi:hypothetical protein